MSASRGTLGQHDAWPARRPSSSRCGRPIRTRACARSRKSASRSGRGGDARHRLARREGAKAAEQRRPPSFSARISKSRLFGSKLFQTILWRFCGISRGYKGSKPNLMASKFFRAAGTVSAKLWTPPRRIPPPRLAQGVRARSAVRGRLFCRRREGAFMAASDPDREDFESSTGSDSWKRNAAFFHGRSRERTPHEHGKGA